MNEKNTAVMVVAGIVLFAAGFLAGNGLGFANDGYMGGHESHMRQASETHSMGSMMDSMSMMLDGKTGDEFDQAFLDEMVVHHEGAVVMARQVLATSKRPELITLANDIIGAQEKEIGMMKAWRAAWFR